MPKLFIKNSVFEILIKKKYLSFIKNGLNWCKKIQPSKLLVDQLTEKEC